MRGDGDEDHGQDFGGRSRSRKGATVPHNFQAEHALLGALMYDNAAIASVEGLVQPEHFYEPVHGEIFAAILAYSAASRVADPITLVEKLEPLQAFHELGGIRFLADMFDRAPPAVTAPDYARTIRQAWQRRELAKIGNQLADFARARTDVEVEDVILELERRVLEISTSSKAVALVSAEDAVDRTIEELDNPAASHGVLTGIENLDKALGGMFPGEMILLAARPSMGKSAIASCAALNVARHGVHPNGKRLGAIEINGEMNVEQMTRRHMTDWAFELNPADAPAYSDLRKRKATVEQRQLIRHVAGELRQLKTLKMLKKTGLTVPTLRGLVRRQKSAWEREGIELGLVTVDHAGLFRSDNPRSGRYESQTEIAIQLKELADELGVAFLVLLQLSRAVEARDDKRPTLPDLRDSGAWEENADAVVGVYRDAYYAQREAAPKKSEARLDWEMRKDSRVVEAILMKIREGAAGVAELWADMPRNAIRSSAPSQLYDGSQAILFSPPPAVLQSPPPAPFQAPQFDPEEFA